MRPFQNSGRNGARLGNQSEIAGQSGLRRKARIKMDARCNQPHAIRAYNANGGALGNVAQFIRQRIIGRETSGDNHRRCSTEISCFLHKARHAFARRRDHHHIGDEIEPRQRWRRRKAINLTMVGIDEGEPTLKPA